MNVVHTRPSSATRYHLIGEVTKSGCGYVWCARAEGMRATGPVVIAVYCFPLSRRRRLRSARVFGNGMPLLSNKISFRVGLRRLRVR
jgi:hypothetical protein